jgi:hypothetical protein
VESNPTSLEEHHGRLKYSEQGHHMCAIQETNAFQGEITVQCTTPKVDVRVAMRCTELNDVPKMPSLDLSTGCVAHQENQQYRVCCAPRKVQWCAHGIGQPTQNFFSGC